MSLSNSVYIIIIFILVGLSIGAYYLFWKSSPVVQSKKPPELFRVPVHEAGHLMLAWYSNIVTEIFLVEANMFFKNGVVRYYTIDPNSRDDTIYCHWTEVIIGIGGICAELFVYKNSKSLPAKLDLSQLRDRVDKILDLDNTFKQDVSCKLTQDFSKGFSNGLTKKELHLFNVAYNEAYEIFQKRKAKFYRLVSILVRHRTLTNKQIEKILGSRAILRIVRPQRARIY